MKEIVLSRYFWRHLLILSIFLIANPYILVAQDWGYEYKGYYSKELKNKIDKTKLRIHDNLESYKNNKSIVHLDESYNLIIQSTDDIYSYLKMASQKELETPKYNKVEKIKSQIERLEIVDIGNTELPYLCNQLYEIGQFYIDTDKKKAKQCFRDIIVRFTSYEFKGCNKKAEFALEDLK